MNVTTGLIRVGWGFMRMILDFKMKLCSSSVLGSPPLPIDFLTDECLIYAGLIKSMTSGSHYGKRCFTRFLSDLLMIINFANPSKLSIDNTLLK